MNKSMCEQPETNGQRTFKMPFVKFSITIGVRLGLLVCCRRTSMTVTSAQFTGFWPAAVLSRSLLSIFHAQTMLSLVRFTHRQLILSICGHSHANYWSWMLDYDDEAYPPKPGTNRSATGRRCQLGQVPGTAQRLRCPWRGRGAGHGARVGRLAALASSHFSFPASDTTQL